MARRPSTYATLSLSEKLQLCSKAETEPTWTQTDLAKWATREFNTPSPVGRTTVHGILKRRREYVGVPDAHHDRKRHCSARLRTSDNQLMQKINDYKTWHANATITGATVLALKQHIEADIAHTPGGDAPTRGWLYRFQQRTGLWFSLRHGEGGSLNQRVVVEGRRLLKEIVAQYNSRDVYNMDETSFFYRREPRGTLTLNKNEKGKKQGKERITVCVATNADGSDRLPLHYIGKSKVPRPLKGRDVFTELGATYTNTAKAWMNTAKYCDWLTQLNESMKEQQRHILILVDNVSSHNHEAVELSNIKVQKLPPNTTAAFAADGSRDHKMSEG